MFTVIYSFQLKPKQDKIFIKAWSDLTKLILEYEGSLGSRLHLESDGKYIAYAQWPSKKKWENFGTNLPEKAKEISKAMHDACIQMDTIHQLKVIEDLLKR